MPFAVGVRHPAGIDHIVPSLRNSRQSGFGPRAMVGSMSEPENSDWAKPSSREVGGGGSETVIDADTARHDPQTAVTVAKIKALRQSIDNVDTAIVSLLAERFKYTSQVGVLKARPDSRRRITSARTTRSNGCTASPSTPDSIPTSRKCTGNSWWPRPRSGISASPTQEGSRRARRVRLIGGDLPLCPHRRWRAYACLYSACAA